MTTLINTPTGFETLVETIVAKYARNNSVTAVHFRTDGYPKSTTKGADPVWRYLPDALTAVCNLKRIADKSIEDMIKFDQHHISVAYEVTRHIIEGLCHEVSHANAYATDRDALETDPKLRRADEKLATENAKEWWIETVKENEIPLLPADLKELIISRVDNWPVDAMIYQKRMVENDWYAMTPPVPGIPETHFTFKEIWSTLTKIDLPKVVGPPVVETPPPPVRTVKDIMLGLYEKLSLHIYRGCSCYPDPDGIRRCFQQAHNVMWPVPLTEEEASVVVASSTYNEQGHWVKDAPIVGGQLTGHYKNKAEAPHIIPGYDLTILYNGKKIRRMIFPPNPNKTRPDGTFSATVLKVQQGEDILWINDPDHPEKDYTCQTVNGKYRSWTKK